MESDFKVKDLSKQPYSVEDRRFMSILENNIKQRSDGHYEMPLPLKSDSVTLPYNRTLAEKRWNQLRARFKKNPEFFDDYQAFMKDVIALCEERVPKDRLRIRDGNINYVPHTGVYHPRKPDQIRVVFDCSAQFEEVSLNDCLLQGPDLTNGLLGVLCRFRQERVAFMTDIKSMFHQFMVAEDHRDLLRFLWWEDGDPNKPVVEYRMKVHLFGASSSPGCANFGLKKAADDGEEEFGNDAASFIRRDFYVDDGLKSVSTAQKAVDLIKSSQKICAKAGLKLHKVISNNKKVLKAIPAEERAKDVKDFDFEKDHLPMERALGVTWCVENDHFKFIIELRDRPLTRRGILSTVSSIYDLNGFVGPVTLKGKQILQQMCRDGLDWDSPIPEELRPIWEKWRNEILELEKLEIERCFKPVDFGEIKGVELHYFSDASEGGYGQCSYIRSVNDSDKAHCAFVIGKARVLPLKQKSIPRLELAAATVSAKMSEFLRNELTYSDRSEYFWSDSKRVLGYINNEARRFHVYVANRVQQIRDLSQPTAWMYVESDENPADDATRGLTARELMVKSRWLTGPEFLWKDGEFQPNTKETYPVKENDPELKKATVLKTTAEGPSKKFPDYFEVQHLKHNSNWFRMRRIVALCLRLLMLLRKGDVKNDSLGSCSTEMLTITLDQLQEAEKSIIKAVQYEHYKEEINILEGLKSRAETGDRASVKLRNQRMKKTSSPFRLDPFLDEDGILRVGGRIKSANVPLQVTHPVIIPKKSHITEVLIRHHHVKVNHMGRGMTHNELRQRGCWIVRGSFAISSFISRCITCRKLRKPSQQQKMAELPGDRLEPAALFSYCAVDYFGPFMIKERRSEVKRYGVLFACMASRSVHLETANSLNTSSFINALTRFLSRRGPVRQLRSDHGTNFIGARNELKAAISEMNQDKVQEYLLDNECEWIPLKLNVPHSSHMGGSWERQIQTVRNALEALLIQSGTQLDDEAFRTFMTEVESIVNSKPLSIDNLCSADAPEPLTPNHLLTMKPKVLLPPPGNFQRADVYCHKHWRRVQYLANQFWLRWRMEYIHLLQVRNKWIRPSKNLEVGDIVISKNLEEHASHRSWPLARVVKIYKSMDGHVRKVRLLMGDRHLSKKGECLRTQSYVDRPIHKLVLILSTGDLKWETEEIPNEEPIW